MTTPSPSQVRSLLSDLVDRLADVDSLLDVLTGDRRSGAVVARLAADLSASWRSSPATGSAWRCWPGGCWRRHHVGRRDSQPRRTTSIPVVSIAILLPLQTERKLCPFALEVGEVGGWVQL